jgi:GNAT superfamily N-acetyltransferase
MLLLFAQYPFFHWLKRCSSCLRSWFSAWIYGRGKAYLFELRLSAAILELPAPERHSDSLEFREITRDELPRCAALAELPLAEVRRRHEFGDRCFGFFAAGQSVNVNWLHFGSCYVYGPGLFLNLAGKDCYLYGVFTDPAHRGQGLYTQALAEIASQLRARGIERIVQVVEEGNDVPLRTLPRLGYRKTGIIRHTTIFSVKKTAMLGLDGRKVISQLYWRSPRGVFWI